MHNEAFYRKCVVEVTSENYLDGLAMYSYGFHNEAESCSIPLMEHNRVIRSKLRMPGSMKRKSRIFGLLMRKNIAIRKHHWIQSLVLQVCVPICLILISQIITLITNADAKYIPNDTHYPRESEKSLMTGVPAVFNVRYTPSNVITDKIMKDTRICLGLNADRVVRSDNENNMVKDYVQEGTNITCENGCVGIIFESISNNGTLPKLFKYKLQISAESPSRLFAPDENSNEAKHKFGQVPTVQVPICLDKAYINLVKSNSKNKINISIQQMPYPPYLQVRRVVADGGKVLADLARFALLVVLCVEITFPANEKFIGINILMLVNGVSNWLNLLSWIVSGALWSASYLIPLILILKYFWPPIVLPFLLYGDSFLVWVVLFIHVCHLLTFGLHISAYFWKPSRGVFVTAMTMQLLHILTASLQGLTVQRILLYLGIFLPNFLLNRIFDEIAANENNLYGIRWSNFFISASDALPEGSIGVIILFSIIGMLFHFSMAVYIHTILPGKYGVPRHPLYCFQRKKHNKQDNRSHIVNYNRNIPTKHGFEYIEPGSCEPGIEIRGLRKVYKSEWFGHKKVDAVRGISMEIYKNQITVLLGHNGAGKTTMMSILSGLTDATEGVVLVNGRNILNQTDNIDNNIGLCPQENMLFPDLTVRQQLMFFGMIKANNKSRHQLDREIRSLLVKVNLTDKTDVYPEQMSGGQKRRLCLALALIGNAEVLILDEPTSGMDTESKREVWDILLNMRGERIIIISTHDMEEADILGDRVAIMHIGELRSYGTSMYLKRLYGHGQIEVKLSIEPWFNVTEISRKIDIDLRVIERTDDKIVLTLPPTESLPETLDKLENSKKQLGITGMSVSIMTLEQVFLRVTNDDADEQNMNNDIEVFRKVTGFSYYLQTFVALLNKKWTYASKNLWGFMISSLLPCLSVMLILLQFGRTPDPNYPYKVSLDVYPGVNAFVQFNRPLFGDMYLNTIENFGGSAIKIERNMSLSDVLLDYGRKNVGRYRNKVVVSAEFNSTSHGDVSANGLYSGAAVFGIPITINCITNTIVKALTNDEEYKIEMSMQTFPHQMKLNERYDGVGSTLTVSLIIFLAPAIALYVIQPLDETLSGVKDLQMMTGAPKSMYWAATFLFDFVQYFISILLLLALFIVADISLETQLYHKTEICITLKLLTLFGMSALPFVYVCTFFKRSSNATIMALTVMPIIMVFIEIILYAVALNPNSSENYRSFWEIQSQILLLVPHLTLTFGHIAFFQTLVQNSRCRRMPDDLLKAAIPNLDSCVSQVCENHVCLLPLPYNMHYNYIPNLEKSLLWLGMSSIFYFSIIFVLEQQYFAKIVARIRATKRIFYSSAVDAVVKKENEIINRVIAKLTTGHNYEYYNNGNILLAQALRKNYGNLHAVKGISFRVKESECFGLLGVNGAGKSTTFKMLTGEIIPNGGTVYLKQFNISSDRSNYLSSMGYCPQKDAIIPTLNSWDHLNLFARLRGIPSKHVQGIVNQWLTKLNLSPCAYQPSGTYSGGNKRRLNIALALIGNPPLVLMDEPTTGVDPAARRSLWNILKTCRNAGQSIILTSHSMEECELLCNRLIIMVGGRIVCVGPSEELKQRFGVGYNIHIKLACRLYEDNVDAIRRRIISELKCYLIDQNTGFLAYHVIDPAATWTKMYSLMDELKNEYNCIEDYVILSSTLEQLFIQFARAPSDQNDNNDYFYEDNEKWENISFP